MTNLYDRFTTKEMNMDFSNQLKKYRERDGYSQEHVAEKLYVSRQTISKWENDKTYPDIHNLIALSVLFDISLDELIKGDLEKMKKTVERDDIQRYKRFYSAELLGVLLFIMVFPISWFKGFIPGMALAVIVLLLGAILGLRADKIKKVYDVQTFREIIAFTKGETLDDIEKIRESGKRVYQKVLSIVGWGLLGGASVLITQWLIRVLH